MNCAPCSYKAKLNRILGPPVTVQALMPELVLVSVLVLVMVLVLVVVPVVVRW